MLLHFYIPVVAFFISNRFLYFLISKHDFKIFYTLGSCFYCVYIIIIKVAHYNIWLALQIPESMFLDGFHFLCVLIMFWDSLQTFSFFVDHFHESVAKVSPIFLLYLYLHFYMVLNYILVLLSVFLSLAYFFTFQSYFFSFDAYFFIVYWCVIEMFCRTFNLFCISIILSGSLHYLCIFQ